ncbi:MAG: hypothetical protein ACK5QX_00055, partial [bacterium]
PDATTTTLPVTTTTAPGCVDDGGGYVPVGGVYVSSGRGLCPGMAYSCECYCNAPGSVSCAGPSTP